MQFGTHATCLKRLLEVSWALDWVLGIFTSTSSISCYTQLVEANNKWESGSTTRLSLITCFSSQTSTEQHHRKDLVKCPNSVLTLRGTKLTALCVWTTRASLSIFHSVCQTEQVNFRMISILLSSPTRPLLTTKSGHLAWTKMLL